MSSKKSVSSFSCTFFIPSLELRAAISNSKTASLAFPSRERNTMRACFTFSTLIAISQICISFFHELYLSVTKTGGEMYFEGIIPFKSATNVNLKIIKQNINYKTTKTADIRRENIHSSSFNNNCIYDNGSLSSFGLKPPHFQESIQGRFFPLD